MSEYPSTHRFYQWLKDRFGIPVIVSGLSLGILLALLVFVVELKLGLLDEILSGTVSDIGLRAVLILYLLIGYVTMAQYYLRIWSKEHMVAIETAFRLKGSTEKIPQRTLLWVGMLGSFLFFVSFFSSEALVENTLLLPADFFIAMFGGFFLGWFNFRFLYELWWYANLISRKVELIQSLDVLDRTSVSPFALQGVRSCLLAIGLLSISANLWLDPDAPIMGTAFTFGTFVVAAVFVLVMPTFKIHLKMQSERQIEVDRIRATLRCLRLTENRSREESECLRADLALERRLMEASVWPMDAGSYGRVFLYLALGLGSWVGAALVERAMNLNF